MRALLAPGVALMNRLRYPQKFTLVSLVLAVPTGLMMYLWLAEIGDRLAFAARERAGVEYVVALRGLLEPLTLGADPDAAAVRAVDVVDRRFGAMLETTASWQLLQTRLGNPGIPRAARLTEAVALVTHVGDTSNLILDPDLDSYYLMDATVVLLPALVVQLAVISAPPAGRPGAAVQAERHAARVLSRAVRDAVARGNAVAFRANPGLEPALGPPLVAAAGSVEAVLTMDDDAAYGSGSDRASVLTAAALRDVFAYHEAAAAALDGLLAARMDALRTRRTWLLLLVAVAIVAVAYLWAAFYAGVVQAVTRLDRVSRRMLTGDFTRRVVADTRDELHQVVESFNSIAARLRTEWERADAATRAKSDFLAMVSHEIRTPLSGVLGMLHLLLETPLSDRQRRYAETIRRSGEALLGIVNDILDLSKMEAGKLELQLVDFDPGAVVAGVVELLGPRAREKHLTLDSALAPDVPRALRGDAGRLRQVLLNLVGNALKFTDSGGVRVDVTRPAAGPALRFAVTDTGIGIPPEAQPRLFQDFSQVDDGSGRRFGGTGLGLAISKRIVAAMGGQIGVESACGRGSTFWFAVEFPPAVGEVAADAPAAEAAVPPMRVLVAEDDPVTQEVTVGLLRRRGHVVDVVSDGRAAVEALRARAYDVVLMDLHMPGQGGIDAARAIRSLSGVPGRMRIIALTASATRNSAEEARAAGMDGHLTKPIDPVELAAALGRAWPRDDATTAEAGGDGEVDEEHLRQLVDSLGSAKVSALVASLPEHVRPHREHLAQARARGDLPGVRAAAHAMGGIAASLGLAAVSELTGAIEQECLAGQSERVSALCERLEPSLDAAIARLRRVEAGHGAPSQRAGE